MSARATATAMLLGALLAPGAAPAQEVMQWLMPDVPPASIPHDGQPSDGIADQVVHYVAAHWPEVQHRYVYANAKRTWLMLEQGEHVCVAAALRTPERERIAYFVSTNLVPPIQLVVQQDALARLPLNTHGEADLSQMLANPALRGIVVDKRSYGAAVDALLAQRPSAARLETTAVGDYGRNVLKLVALGRVDYAIDYDYALQYAQRSEAGMEHLLTVPMSHNSKLMPAGIACPRNAWGRAMAQRIDRIIGTPEGAQAMLKAQNSWHTAATRERYAPQLQQFQRQRSKPAPAADFR